MILVRNMAVLLVLLLIITGCRQDAGQPVADEQPPVSGLSPLLLTVAEVAALLATTSPPLVIEISKAENFAEGHLTGATNLWRPDYADDVNYPYGGMQASREKMARLLGRMGAKNDELIIVYCTKGSADAARIQWILRGYGHDQVAMMDGGKVAWQLAGYPLTVAVSASRTPEDYHFARPEQEKYCASLGEVLEAITDTNTIIVDTREDYEYLGIPHLSGNRVVRHKAGAFAPGAIPGARHLNWSEAVDLHADHTFKSLADLKHNFLREGITSDKQIIVYCHSGVRSAHTTFVLKDLLAYPDVKNYDGSWIEWSYFYAADTTGKIQQLVSLEETEIIYRDLVAGLQEKAIE